MERLCFEKKTMECPAPQSCLGKCFPEFSLQTLKDHGAVVEGGMFKLVVDLGIIHVTLGLQACRRQEFWDHRDFLDFKGRPERPGNVWQDQNPYRRPQEGDA
jgi:hypothetical protein